MSEGSESSMSALARQALGIDHLAVAVPDLEVAIEHYVTKMGFELAERRETHGAKTAMVSAVLKAGPITLVLVQGTTPESQVSRYIERYGPGLQHIAFLVEDLPGLAEKLKTSGVEFDTTLIQGDGIRQMFTHRDPHSGMMFELIERQDENGRFTDESVQSLFHQLEASDSF